MKHDISQFTQFKEMPSPLPEGERVLWQGKPTVKGLALRAFHVRDLPFYFGAFLVWRLWSNYQSGAPFAEFARSIAWLVGPAIVSAAVLFGLAWLFARASCYTITSQRVLLQFGVALPVTMNIPLAKIAGASVKIYGDGSGDIPLALADKERVSHLLLWPHVRPWKLVISEPMLRAVPDAAAVSATLKEALSGLHGPQALAMASVTRRDLSLDQMSGSAASAAA